MRHVDENTSRRLSAYFYAGVAAMLWAATAIMPAQAADFLKGDHVHLTSLHRIDGDVYAAGEKVTVDGSIDGDLLALGGSVTCTGEITGSENIGAGEFSHTGRVDGSIRMICGEAEIEGYVGRSVLFVGNILKVRQAAIIRKDVNAYGSRVDLAGTVMGNVEIKATRIKISGQIDGDVELEAEESIDIHAPAVIRGNLTYSGAEELDLEAAGVTVLGEVTRLEPKDEVDAEAEDLTNTVLRFSGLFAAFLFGLILIWLCPAYLQEAFVQLHRRFMVSVATGLLAGGVVVMSALVLLVAIVLSVVGLIMSSGDQAASGAVLLIFSTLMLPITSFAVVSGGVLFYAGKLLPAFLVGYGLIRIFKHQPRQLGKWQLLIGLTFMSGFFAIPVVGLLFYLAAGIIGAGAIILGIKNCRRNGSKGITVPDLPQPGTPPPLTPEE